MEHNRFSGRRIGPGASTVLMILLMLCLTLLGVLSLNTAQNDLVITERALQAETAYYQAQLQASCSLAELDEALAAGTQIVDPEENMITLEIPVDERRIIRIVAAILSGGEKNCLKLIENRVVIIPEEMEIW